MAQLQTPFNALQFDPTQSSGGQLPIGKSLVVIKSSEIKPTNDGESGKLSLTLEVIEGPYQGSTGWYELNIYNKSQQASEIAHKQLSALCHVVGVFDVRDTVQLHNIPFVVECALKPPTEKYPDSKFTEVKRVYDAQGNEPGKQGQATAQPVQAQNVAPASAAPAGWGAQAPASNPATSAPAWGTSQPAQPASSGPATWAPQTNAAVAPASAPAWAVKQ